MKDAGDGFGVSLPFGKLALELRASVGRELVELRFAVVLGESPLAFDEAFALEAVERGVQRAFLDEERRLLLRSLISRETE